MAGDNICATPAYMSMNRSIKRHFIDSNRRWDKYNRSLVDRCFDLLSPSFFKNWNELLQEISKEKKGRSYKVPNCFIAVLAKIRAVFNVTFKMFESIAMTYCTLAGKRTIHYHGLFKRIMGEVIRAVKPEYMEQELRMKAAYFNEMRSMTFVY